MYLDWKSFEADLVEHFCPQNKQLSAITSLEGTSWHQGRDSVEDYIDRFMELTDLAEYQDEKMVMIKFHKCLDPGIQTKVALLGDGSPDFDNPQGWYEAARRVARNKAANEAFMETAWSSLRTNPKAPLLNPTLTSDFRTPRIFSRVLENPRLPSMPIPIPARDGLTPMDVDQAWNERLPQVNCH